MAIIILDGLKVIFWIFLSLNFIEGYGYQQSPRRAPNLLYVDFRDVYDPDVLLRPNYCQYRSILLNLTHFRGPWDGLWRVRLWKQLQYCQRNSYQSVVLVPRTREGICWIGKVPRSSWKSNARLGVERGLPYLPRERWLYCWLHAGRKWIND